MVAKVKQLLSSGQRVKIFTARVCSKHSPEEIAEATAAIKEWCKEVFGQELEITAEKDMYMIECYDDRAIQVELNTGRLIAYEDER
jgi:hypothetical protein